MLQPRLLLGVLQLLLLLLLLVWHLLEALCWLLGGCDILQQ
jgi:hypothetical protein